MIIIRNEDIVDYQPESEFEHLFIREGYAKELKEAQYILNIKDEKYLSSSCTLADLLIKKEEKINGTVVYTGYSGRKTECPSSDKRNGRMINVTKVPKFTGEFKNLPFTYTLESLSRKCVVLQERLNDFGAQKVESLSMAMQSIPDRLMSIENKYRASFIYDDFAEILEKIRKMK